MDKAGLVVIGLAQKGNINVGDKLLLGPFRSGGYRSVVVASLYVYKVPTRSVMAGQTVAISFRGRIGKVLLKEQLIRRGMVLVDTRSDAPRSSIGFEAKIILLRRPTQVTPNYQPVVYIGISLFLSLSLSLCMYVCMCVCVCSCHIHTYTDLISDDIHSLYLMEIYIHIYIY